MMHGPDGCTGHTATVVALAGGRLMQVDRYPCCRSWRLSRTNPPDPSCGGTGRASKLAADVHPMMEVEAEVAP